MKIQFGYILDSQLIRSCMHLSLQTVITNPLLTRYDIIGYDGNLCMVEIDFFMHNL
jgi:hypothetical protein